MKDITKKQWKQFKEWRREELKKVKDSDDYKRCLEVVENGRYPTAPMAYLWMMESETSVPDETLDNCRVWLLENN